MSKIKTCYWDVFVKGKILNLARKRCIETIDMEELCDGSDTCSITIADPDFLFINDNIFIEEAPISVRIGWHGDTHCVTFDGFISAIDIDFPENGYPTLNLFCMDNSHLMNRKKKNRSWDNITRAEVVQKIAQEYGFKCVIESGYAYKKEETISQSGATDIEFCESLASEERDPFMCKLVDKTLYYVKKGILKKPSATLKYREYPFDVVSFKPQINKETKKEEVESADINISDKTVDSAVANDESTSRENQGEPVKTSSKVGAVYDNATGRWEEEK